MPQAVQVGAILTNKSSLMIHSFGLETVPCSRNWSLINAPDAFALDRKIHAAGWNFFFMAAEVKVRFFGGLGAKKIQNALQRIVRKVKQQNFNGLEVTESSPDVSWGVPYTVVTAHSRHVQQSCYLDSAEARQVSQHHAEWARG
jgi:hypothetical protein